MSNKSIAVIGAGIAGITAAYYAAKEGYEVTVYDKERYPAMRCSHANGGQISVSNSEVWTTWGNVYKGIKWVLKKDAPLLIRPSLDYDKASWLAKFLYHTAKNEYARNTAETIRMGILARKLYDEICTKEHIFFDRLDNGILHIYKDKKYMKEATLVKELYNSNGCEWDLLNPSEVKRIEPSLSNVDDIIGGAFTPSDFTGDIHKFCLHLAKTLQEKYNVKFVYNYSASNIMDTFKSKIGFMHDKIIIAAGVNSVNLAKEFNDKLPIYPVKGYSITIEANGLDSFNSMPKVSLLDDQAKIVSSLLGNRLRVAGTAELTGENYDIRFDRIKPLLNWVETNFPNVDTNQYSSWACLRPMTPNMMPIVTRSKQNNRVYYHTGHGHLGWTLAPYTANLLIKQIMSDENNE